MGAATLNADTKTHIALEDGNLHYGVSQDIEPILKDVKNRVDYGARGSSEMRHAAKIPMVIIEQYLNKTGITFDEFMGSREHMKRIVNDPANAPFRIWQGRI